MSFAAWLTQLDMDALWSLLVTVSASLLCITVHEASHGLMACCLGDPTAKRMGRLTLNPLKHIDPVGLLMMAVAKFGWAKPVPVDMRRFRDPKLGMALTAMAGPLSNVLLAGVALMGYSVCAFYSYMTDSALLYWLGEFFVMTTLLSCGLAVFNLFPIPPLDGSKMLFAVLPAAGYEKLMRYERYGMLALMALLATGALDVPLTFLRGALLDGLMAVCTWPFDLLMNVYF